MISFFLESEKLKTSFLKIFICLKKKTFFLFNLNFKNSSKCLKTDAARMPLKGKDLFAKKTF